MINANDEIYGGCRHRAHFHRFRRQTQKNPLFDTDDAGNAERVENSSDPDSVEKMTDPIDSADSIDSTESNETVGYSSVKRPLLVVTV